MHDGENRNASSFSAESLEKCKNTFVGKPILAFFNKTTDGIEEHNSSISYDAEYDTFFYDYTDWNAEYPVGYIDNIEDVEVVDYEGKKWIKVVAKLWIKYNYKLIKNLIKAKTRKVSIEVEIVDSYEGDDGVEYINEFVCDGITILQYEQNSTILVEEGMEGAHLRIKDAFAKMKPEAFNKYKKAMCFALKGEIDDTTNNTVDDTSKDDANFVPTEGSENEPSTVFDIVKLNEEGLGNMFYSEKRKMLATALTATVCTGDYADCYLYVEDFSDTEVVYSLDWQDTKMCGYSVSEDGVCTVDSDNSVDAMLTWKRCEHNQKVQETYAAFKALTIEKAELQATIDTFTTEKADLELAKTKLEEELAATSVTVDSSEEFAAKIQEKEAKITELEGSIAEFAAKLEEAEATILALNEEAKAKFIEELTANACQMVDDDDKIDEDEDREDDEIEEEEDELDDDEEKETKFKARLKQALAYKINKGDFTKMDEISKFVKTQLALKLYSIASAETDETVPASTLPLEPQPQVAAIDEPQKDKFTADLEAGFSALQGLNID